MKETKRTSGRPPEHGHASKGGSPEYRCWRSMHKRCNNPRQVGYEYYGGRGITIAAEWYSFQKFYADMGPRPPHTTLDRIDTNGNYEPGNCRWASHIVQANNKSSNLPITFEGITLNIGEWADKLGINRQALYKRFRSGWNAEKAFKTPVRTSSLNLI